MSRSRALLAAAVAAAVAVIAIAAVMADGSGSSPTTTVASPTTRGSGTPTVTTTSTSTSTPTPETNPPGRPAPVGVQYGVNVNYLFNGSDFTAGQVGTQLGALRRTGVTIARSDAFWEASEPTAPVNGVHHYDWAFDDRVAGTLAAYGLQWLPILDYTAPWAQSIAGQDHSPPSSDAAYAAYASAFAARYGTGGAFWRAHPGLRAEPVQAYEIWNEPDNAEFWTPRPNAGGTPRCTSRPARRSPPPTRAPACSSAA